MASIHWLQHVSFEGLGSMEPWLKNNGHTLSCTRLWAGETLPAPDAFEALIVMGGPMGIYDHEQYPWLIAEKKFLAAVVARHIPVMGICLGAQLLANVLGAKVSANQEKEIGWFPITACGAMPESLASCLPEKITAFHWHGDTFSLPPGARCLYSSEACKNQAFLLKDHVLALQFHLETTRESAASLIDNCRHELVTAPWIMTEEEILRPQDKFHQINNCMHKLLQNFFPPGKGSITGD